LNKGEDAYRPDLYGDTISVERIIEKTGTTSNPYRLLDSNGKIVSRLKSDLDNMLDQLNIQVENPVAVLDQEEAKKFLTGSPADKYKFFQKATELERIDIHYRNIKVNIEELEEKSEKVKKGLRVLRDHVKKLEEAWNNCQALEKLEDEIEELQLEMAWSVYALRDDTLQEQLRAMQIIEDKFSKRKQDVAALEHRLNSPDGEQQLAHLKLQELTGEANEAMAALRELDQKYKDVTAPVKQDKKELAMTEREIKVAEREVKLADGRLQEERDKYAAQAGNAKDDIINFQGQIQTLEVQIQEAEKAQDEERHRSNQLLELNDTLERDVKNAEDNTRSHGNQMNSVVDRIRNLESSSGNNNVSMFGPKCLPMLQRVNELKRQNRFRGPVFGPMGAFIKVVEGKEGFAALAEKAMGRRSLDKFVCVHDSDRRLLTKLRNDVQCRGPECGLIMMNESAAQRRYNIDQSIPNVPGIETVSSVLSVEENLVFNCLVDSFKIDIKALAESKELSEQHLLHSGPGNRYSIYGGKVTQVYFKPHGDYWQVRNGNLNMTSNDSGALRQTFGVDKTAALRTSNEELEILKQEHTELRATEREKKIAANETKKQWNQCNKKIRNLEKLKNDLGGDLEAAKEQLLAVQANINSELDTTDLEDEVRNAREFLASQQSKKGRLEQLIADKSPAIESVKNEIEEIKARNVRVANDISEQEKIVNDFDRNRNILEMNLNKKRSNLSKTEEALTTARGVVADCQDKCDKALALARLNQYKHDKNHMLEDGEEEVSNEQLSQVEIRESDKHPNDIKAKIQRKERKLSSERQKRQLANQDPEEVKQKYDDARKDLSDKITFVEKIEDNIIDLNRDLKARKKLYKQFRKHIADMTNVTFDEKLNQKGSSGFVEFDHENGDLNLIVQKDCNNEQTQTKDVKALSGGERSYTTLALLIALGEHLETPFRVMDEFDVFLDPISRKLALEAMIQMAKSMSHRQFIFITPQDLSNLPADRLLKIHQLKPPERGGQQTLV